MATLREIAEAADVSVYTVSMVLNGKARQGRISTDRARQIEDIAARLNYRPHAAARAMRNRKTRQIGVLVPNNPGNRFTHPLAYETILGINEGLQGQGYVAALTRIDDVKSDLARNSRVFQEHMLDGMIVLDSMPPEVERRLEELIPTCMWCDSNVWRDVCCVRRDEAQAGRLAAEQALAMGYRDITFLGYRTEHAVHFSFTERRDAVRRTLAAAGIELIEVGEPTPEDIEARRRLIDRLAPDHLIICNSIYQAHAMRSMGEEAGLIPGRDYGLISCDDMKQLDRLWPSLARVSFDRYEMGVAAAQLMFAALNQAPADCPSVLISSQWIAGSTAKSREK